MTTELDDTSGLAVLQSIIGAYEVNTVMMRNPGDVAFIQACDTPHASEICCVGGKGYDVWRWNKKGDQRRLVKVGLEVGAAANIVIMEYMRAKVQRAKKNDPRLRQYSNKVLLAHLLKGYQDEIKQGEA